MDLKEFDEFFARVDEAKEIIEQYKDVQGILDRIFLLENYLKQFGSLEKLLKHMRALEQYIYLQKEFLNVEETAEYLCMSQSFVYNLAQSKKVACYKPSNKAMFFSIEDINNWISTHRIMSYDEIKRNGLKRVVEMKQEKREKLERLKKKLKEDADK